MDSRLLHCGGANRERRRCLMYFTLRNPHFSGRAEDFPPEGSLWGGMELEVDDLNKAQ